MKLSKLLGLCAAAVVAIGLIAPGANADEHQLRVGVEGAYKPFSWKEPDGSLKGFDIDFSNAVCAHLKKECVLVEQDWDGMIPALLAKKFDVIIASMSITEERMKRVDFTNKYYNTPARFVAKEGSGLEATADGLAGKRVGVQRATTHQCYLEKMFPKAELVLYGTQEEVFQDLAAGRIDAQISDSIQALDGFLKTDAGKGYAFLGGDQHDDGCHGVGAGIALRKGNEELKQAINEAIKAIRDSGEYKTMNDKYFDIDIYGPE